MLSSSQLQRDVASRAFSAARRQRAQCTGSCRGRLCACRIARERYGFVSPSLSDSSRAYSRPAESTRTRYSEPSERVESRRRPLASTRLRARARAHSESFLSRCVSSLSFSLSRPPSNSYAPLSPVMAKTYRYSRVAPTAHWCHRRRVTRACSLRASRACKDARHLSSPCGLQERGTPRIPAAGSSRCKVRWVNRRCLDRSLALLASILARSLERLAGLFLPSRSHSSSEETRPRIQIRIQPLHPWMSSVYSCAFQ